MIQFNDLRISPCGKHLIIDVSVREEEWYTEVYLDTITIDNQDTYVENGPSANPIFTYEVPPLTSRQVPERPLYRKQISLELDSTTLGSLDGIFFVYVSVRGIASPETPCGMDNIVTMGTVANIYPYYRQAMNYIKELANTCTIPKNFIDYMLKLKALKLAIRTGHYPDAIKYFNKFFRGKGHTIHKGGCGCGNS